MAIYRRGAGAEGGGRTADGWFAPAAAVDGLSAGWVQFGVDEHGRPVYGYIGPPTPRWHYPTVEEFMDDFTGRRDRGG